jgi:hypothetical protein
MNIEIKRLNNNQLVSIEEVICTLKNVDYIFQKVHQKETLDKKIKNINQNNVESINKTIKILRKLDEIIENDKIIRENKIKNLHEVLKQKFDRDIYLLYVGYVSNCQQINENQKKIKQSTSTTFLFELIFEEINKNIIELLSDSNYIILNNLFNGEIENNFQNIIQNIIKNKNNNDAIYYINMAHLYLYVILKYKKLFNFYEGLIIIERILISQIADYENLDQEKYLLKYLPSIFIDTNLKTKARKYINVYYKSQIDELNKKINYQYNQILISNSLNENLTNKVKEFSEEIKKNKNEIKKLEIKNNENNKIIESNEIKLKELNERFEYERNRADKQNKDLKNSLITSIQNSIKIEIEELNNFADNLQQNDCEILKRIIDNINQSLKSF